MNILKFLGTFRYLFWWYKNIYGQEIYIFNRKTGHGIAWQKAHLVSRNEKKGAQVLQTQGNRHCMVQGRRLIQFHPGWRLQFRLTRPFRNLLNSSKKPTAQGSWLFCK